VTREKTLLENEVARELAGKKMADFLLAPHFRGKEKKPRCVPKDRMLDYEESSRKGGRTTGKHYRKLMGGKRSRRRETLYKYKGRPLGLKEVGTIPERNGESSRIKTWRAGHSEHVIVLPEGGEKLK